MEECRLEANNPEVGEAVFTEAGIWFWISVDYAWVPIRLETPRDALRQVLHTHLLADARDFPDRVALVSFLRERWKQSVPLILVTPDEVLRAQWEEQRIRESGEFSELAQSSRSNRLAAPRHAAKLLPSVFTHDTMHFIVAAVRSISRDFRLQSADRDDLIQETAIKVYEAIEARRIAGDFRVYCTKVVKRTTLEMLCARRARSRDSEVLVGDSTDVAAAVGDRASYDDPALIESAMSLQGFAWNKMSARIADLRSQGFSFSTIATATGLSAAAVRKRWSRLLERARQFVRSSTKGI